MSRFHRYGTTLFIVSETFNNTFYPISFAYMDRRSSTYINTYVTTCWQCFRVILFVYGETFYSAIYNCHQAIYSHCLLRRSSYLYMINSLCSIVKGPLFMIRVNHSICTYVAHTQRHCDNH